MRLRDLDGQRVVIWGAGRECNAVLGAMERISVNAHVSVVDEAENGPVAIGKVPVLRGDDKDYALKGADVVVRSPGISRYRGDVAELTASGIAFTTATNLWFAEGFDNVIGITGTKGKSTTASLLAHLMSAVGLDVVLAGNIGRPAIDLLGTVTPRWWVVELSSYQTADMDTSPQIGVLTSLSPEHLDWHGDETTYRRDKLNLFAHRSDMRVVTNAADAGAREAMGSINAAILCANETPHGRVSDGFFEVQGVPIASVNAFRLLGQHNRELACVALTVLESIGTSIATDSNALAHSLTTFEPLPHRLEPVTEINGVTYVDDSISTTPAATLAALRAFDGHAVTVLVGGFDRGVSYDELAQYVVRNHDRVRVIALPDSGARVIEVLREVGGGETVTMFQANDVRHGVEIASEITPTEGVVLLSPGAPSFGRFRDYIERAEVFRAAVEELRA